MKTLLSTVVWCLSAIYSIAQFSNPDPGYVFDDATIPRIDIEIAPDSLEFILAEENLSSDYEFVANFYFTKEGVVDTMEQIGFRLRGNTSRNAVKKSFKIAFNSFEKGRKFYGLEKMNLNGEHNDPSLMRSKTNWDVFADKDILASRTNHVRFYINNEYRGLYLNVEHIDEEFVQKRFQQDFGNLYKCLYPADLNYKGSDPDLYKEFIFGRRAYELKTNKEQDNYSDLAHFIDILNNTSDANFVCEIEKVFSVDNYLRVIVIDILASNWDGPMLNKNNFYLYYDPATGQFNYVPYDLDNTYGIDWLGVDWPYTGIYDWSAISGEYRPIYERLMNVSSYRDRVSYYFNKYLEEYFNVNYLEPYWTTKRDLLFPYRINDVYSSFDYGWGVDEFESSYALGSEGHVPYGLTEYVTLRKETVLEQLEDYEEFPFIAKANINKSDEELQFDFDFERPDLLQSVQLEFSLNENSFEVSDLAGTNDHYSYTYTVTESGWLEYRLIYSDLNGKEYFWPSCDYYKRFAGYGPTPSIVINEVLSSNDELIADEAGEYEDWIEIYNTGDSTVSLEGMYLTDDSEEINKWKIPDLSMSPDSYLIIWADNDSEQGPNHAEFKLSKNGEFLGLFDRKQNDFAPVDTLTLPEIETNKSYGRLPNGTGDFQYLPSVTFNGLNEASSATSSIAYEGSGIFPNPTTGQIFLKQEWLEQFKRIELISSNGKLIWSQRVSKEMNVGHLSSGVYHLVFISDQERKTVPLIVLN